MKKTFLALTLVAGLLLITNATTNACYRCPDGSLGDTDSIDSCPAPTEEPVAETPAPIQGSTCIDCMYPSIKHFNAEVVGNEVRTTFLTTQVMDAYVDYGTGTSQYELGTGHNINFTIMENGTYTLTPRANYQGKVISGQSVEVEITGNIEIVREDEGRGFEFRAGLLTEQIEELLDLLHKEIWTDIDNINWDWATE